jgi:hypothetical protein
MIYGLVSPADGILLPLRPRDYGRSAWQLMPQATSSDGSCERARSVAPPPATIRSLLHTLFERHLLLVRIVKRKLGLCCRLTIAAKRATSGIFEMGDFTTVPGATLARWARCWRNMCRTGFFDNMAVLAIGARLSNHPRLRPRRSAN